MGHAGRTCDPAVDSLSRVDPEGRDAQLREVIALSSDEAAAPVAEEVGAFEFMVERALGIAAHRGGRHSDAVANQLVEPIVILQSGKRGAHAKGEALAPQVR